MKRSLCVLVVGAFLGSAVTSAIGFWVKGGLETAVAQAGGAGTPSGNGDVNGDGKLDVSDGIYMISYVFRGGPAPVPIECAPAYLPATGQTKCYGYTQAHWIQAPCDSADFPGQDGFYEAGCETAGRFVDHGDGTVTDTCTGLMWQKETPPGGYTWEAALKYCENLDLAGHTDWRLPNVRELQSIVDYGRLNPAIDPVFGAESGRCWSSSTCVDTLSSAWGVYFGLGVVNAGAKDNPGDSVRAVRGGL